MATVNIYPKEPKSKNNTLLQIFVYLKGKQFKISTGQSINPKFWFQDKQLVKKSYIGSPELNELLKAMKAETEAIIREKITAKNEVTPQYVKEEFKNRFFGNVNKNNFYEYYDKYVEACKTTKSNATVKAYRSTKERLKDFEEKKNYKITYDSINMEFYDKFLNYIIMELEQSNNTAGKHIKVLRSYLGWALDREYHSNNIFKKFKILKEEADTIALNEEDLEKIKEADLSELPHLEKVRDAFLLLCYTGLRFSDLGSIKEENINSKFINLITVKTQDHLRIPLSTEIRNILEKYPNGNIPVISEPAMNRSIKILGEAAKINENTELVSYQGKQRKITTGEKWEFITTHTGRRTFITLSLQKGMRMETVMKITGHKDFTSFSKYIKLTDNTVYDDMLKIWG